MPSLPYTHEFCTTTSADPKSVWQVLTSSNELGWLYGLSLTAEWRAGSTVLATASEGPQLAGRVLRADPPRLLTYTLGDEPDNPSVYVTWEICAAHAGTIVRLYIDEPDPSPPKETEFVWVEVMAALDRHLDCLRHSGEL